MSNYSVIRKNNEITIVDYNIDGFCFKPKKNLNHNINKLIVIKPSFIEKIIKKKLSIQLKKIMKMTFILFEDNSAFKRNEIYREISVLKKKLRHEYLIYLSKEYVKDIIIKIRNIENKIEENFDDNEQKKWDRFSSKNRSR